MTTELTKAAQQALEACPFCDGPASFCASERGWTAYLHAACDQCGARSPSISYSIRHNDIDPETREYLPPKDRNREVAKLWNTRALTQRPAAQTEREAFEAAMKDSWQMVDPLRPPTAGSYYAGEHAGICAALKTMRANFERHWNARASLPAPQQATPTSGNILTDAFNEVQALKQQATPEPLTEHADHIPEIAARLRLVAKLAGCAEAVPEDDLTAVGCIFSVLGNMRRALELKQATPEPVGDAYHVKLLIEAIGTAAQKAGIYNGQVPLTGPLALMLVDDMATCAATRTAPVETEPVGEPTEGEFFAFDPEGGNAFYKTRQEAIDHAKESLKYYLEGANAHGEWDEDVEQIRWGVVMQRAKATNISVTEDGENSCDYELQHVVTRPAPGVPERKTAPQEDGTEHDYCSGSAAGYVEGWNDCIDAMLAAAQAKGGE